MSTLRRRAARKGQMARRLVWLCIIVLLFTTLWACGLKTYGAMNGATVDLSDVLIFVGGAFGGELLLLLVKRVTTKQTEKENEV